MFEGMFLMKEAALSNMADNSCSPTIPDTTLHISRQYNDVCYENIFAWDEHTEEVNEQEVKVQSSKVKTSKGHFKNIKDAYKCNVGGKSQYK